jgi:biofilm protein TabA
MIIDSLINAQKYTKLHPLFTQAFEFIQSHGDFENTTENTFEIIDGLKAFVAELEGVSKEKSLEKFECHNQNIDIQYCIKGTETFGWKPREQAKNLKGTYNSEKDVSFYDDVPDMYFQLNAGQFAVFFPEDVHAPGIGDSKFKKLVIKVRVS